MTSNLQSLKLMTLALSVALLASCTQNSGSVSPEAEVIAGNIVGGKASTASFQKQNGIVALVIMSEDGEGICTGTLIARQLVLTAAHCLDSSRSAIKSIAVVFAPDVSNVTQEQVRFGVKGSVHKLFLTSAMSGVGSWNDIALLKLDSEAPADFQVARLPAADNLTAPKTSLTQAGFGRAEALREAATDSSGVLRQVAGIQVLSKSADGNELMLNEAKKGSCNGDSGGPAFVKERDGKLTLVGTDSRGTRPESCIGVGIYTNVASHLDWIKEQSTLLLAAAPGPGTEPTPATPPAVPPTSPAPTSPAPTEPAPGTI